MSEGTRQLNLSDEERERFGDDPRALFAENLKIIGAKIEAACGRAGRDPSSVRLLPISKTVPAHLLRLAYDAGITTFGENKIQEAQEKHEALGDLPVSFAIVGHLQTNKARHLARFASEFHALDSHRLAKELNRRLEGEGRDLDVYVQVNTSGEETKFGLAPEDALEFIAGLGDYPRLKLRGLMTLAIFSDERELVRACFQRLRGLRDEALKINPGAGGLSMGMSGDFELAIEEGATVVRVGTSIFGRRPGSDSHYWPGLIPER